MLSVLTTITILKKHKILKRKLGLSTVKIAHVAELRL